MPGLQAEFFYIRPSQAFIGVRNRGGETVSPQFPLARPGVGCWERKRLLKKERRQASQHFGPWGPPLPAQLQVRAQKSEVMSSPPVAGEGSSKPFKPPPALQENPASPILFYVGRCLQIKTCLPSPAPVCRNEQSRYLVETKPRCMISLEKHTLRESHLPLPHASPTPGESGGRRLSRANCCRKGYVRGEDRLCGKVSFSSCSSQLPNNKIVKNPIA